MIKNLEKLPREQKATGSVSAEFSGLQVRVLSVSAGRQNVFRLLLFGFNLLWY